MTKVKDKKKVKEEIKAKVEEKKKSRLATPEEIEAALQEAKAECEALEAEEPDPEPVLTPKKERAPREKKEKQAKPDDLVTAKELASELGTEDRILRRTLRKLEKAKKIKPKQGRWEWAPDSPDLQVIKDNFGKKADEEEEG